MDAEEEKKQRNEADPDFKPGLKHCDDPISERRDDILFQKRAHDFTRIRIYGLKQPRNNKKDCCDMIVCCD